MSRLRAHNIAMSIDGFMAGPDQTLENPMGIGAQRLHQWAFATRSFRRMHGMDGGDTGETGIDDDFIARGDAGIGATIMGRNMFGPIRGPWDDADEWRGWWGDNPPYHHPVFVLTHHAREPLEMEGGTTFSFVTDGIESALAQATSAADGADVRLGGGASAIRQYMRAGLLDDLHVAVAPIILGGGERVFDNLDNVDNLDGGPGYECVEWVPSGAVAHARFTRTTA
jgi:dihydrofolate reductase